MSMSNQFQIEQDRKRDVGAAHIEAVGQIAFERATLDLCIGAHEILALGNRHDLTVGPVEIANLEIAQARIGKFIAAHKQKVAA